MSSTSFPCFFWCCKLHVRNFTHKITQTRLNRQTGLFDTASQFFRFSFASYGFCFIWRRCSASHVQRLDITQRKMFRTIVGWATLDLEDWRATMRRMNDILNAAMPYTSIHPNQPVERWNFQKTIQLSVRGFAHLDRWLGPTSLPQLEPANSNLPPGFCRDICVCYGQLRPPPVHQQISTWVGWAPELVEVSCLQYVQTSNPEKWCSPCGGVAYSWPILLIQCFQQAAASKIVQPCYRVCRAYVFDFFSRRYLRICFDTHVLSCRSCASLRLRN